MTNEEAIEHIRKLMISSVQSSVGAEIRPIAYAFEKGIAALEKQIPKLPIIIGDGYADGEMVYDEWECPSCGSVYEIYSHEYKYCPNCGQAIDWEVT